MAYNLLSLLFLAYVVFTTNATILPSIFEHTYVPSILQTSLTFDKENAGRFKVPGDSHAFHCSDPSSDLFTIQRLDLFPNPPVS